MHSLYADIWKEKLELFAFSIGDKLDFQDFQILEIIAKKIDFVASLSFE